jgi:uncharacterized membrane protein
MSETSSADTFICPVCQQSKPGDCGTPVAMLHEDLAAQMAGILTGLDEHRLICEDCLDQLQGDYFEQMLQQEVGVLDALEQEVVEALEDQELITDNINEEFEERLTFGQRIADKVAAVGGSWAFIIGFSLFLVVWMVINTLLLRRHPFDPYPFILLNLCLSTIAALQAPVIMMSQNRHAAKDRLRAEQDYQVNLKAELQIQHLHEMLDHLMTSQWERMIEIQETQARLMEELAMVARRFNRVGERR